LKPIKALPLSPEFSPLGFWNDRVGSVMSISSLLLLLHPAWLRVESVPPAAGHRIRIVHFVNFDRHQPLAPFSVTVRKQFAGRVKSVLCFSPERDEPVSLGLKESRETVAFTAPGMKLDSMIVVSQE
jgi:hypothetical protein